jgi:hypothetical protein
MLHVYRANASGVADRDMGQKVGSGQDRVIADLAKPLICRQK